MVPGSGPQEHNGLVKVVVTRIGHDGAMHRRVVDTARQRHPATGKASPPCALAAPPPYRPAPGTAAYHIRANGHKVAVGEHDLDGPLRDLITVVPAAGTSC